MEQIREATLVCTISRTLERSVATANEGPWNWVAVSGTTSELKKENGGVQVS